MSTSEEEKKQKQEEKAEEVEEKKKEDTEEESEEEGVEDLEKDISEMDIEDLDVKTVKKLRRGQGHKPRSAPEGEWYPRTELGKLVKSGKITTMHEALISGLPLRESQIVDTLMGDTLEDEVLNVNMVQRMTDSGRRTRFSIIVVVGNSDGYVGLGSVKGKEVGPAIRKAIDNAKLNMIELVRGCGSWECGCMTPHSMPYRVTGKAGSAEVTLRPAPRGVGLAVGDVAKKILKLAGVEDAWGFSRGQTKTTVNNAKAVMDALHKITVMKVQESQRIQLKHVSGSTAIAVPDPAEEGGDE